jgi:GTP-binding protein Era
MTNLDDIFQEDWDDNHRSGFVAVVGRPNVGKSTLINCILGQKIAIVTNKPQTTRKQQLGIYTNPKGQILFTDTPGIHKPYHKLGEYMVNVAEQAIKDADLILWVLDASEEPQISDKYIAESLNKLRGNTPIILVLNQIDKVGSDISLEEHLALIDHVNAIQTSALENFNITSLIDQIISQLPLGPRYYPADQLSEVNMRFIASEVIREKIILQTEQEIPHSVAVEIEDYKERSEDMTYVSGIIYVERDSQKGIIIGKGGEMIKRLGKEARLELAEILGTRVYLDLRVKVLKNWRSDEKLMRRLGYRLPQKD